MKTSTVRRGVVIFLVLDGLLAMWPGLLPFNRIYPLVFGLPFVMAWLTFLMLLNGIALFVMALADRAAGRPSS